VTAAPKIKRLIVKIEFEDNGVCEAVITDDETRIPYSSARQRHTPVVLALADSLAHDGLIGVSE
jgi:hypothetical protein